MVEGEGHNGKATANQVVAFNLFLARILRGWTQDEAAEKLEPHLGERWSKGTFSAAERSTAGRRIRQFDADEVVAFARGFDLPVWWFFVPPEVDAYGRLPEITPPPDVADDQLVGPGELLARVVDLDGLLARFEAAGTVLSPDERERLGLRLESAAQELSAWARHRQQVRERLGDAEVARHNQPRGTRRRGT